MSGDGRAPRAHGWTLFVAAVACLPVLGVFTTTRIFYVRDLSFFFWSRHLWLRHTVAAGDAPWWDPYVAGGQSAIADALNQLLMPVTLAIRLLPSAVVSFNLWVALPLPVAALGTFYFLRRRATPAAAALGACAFALSGPTVSMLNTPNLSWSVSLLPWVLLASARLMAAPSAAAVVVLAMAFALQALCGEPVTWAATGLVTAAFAMVGGTDRESGTAPRVPSAATRIAAVIAGLVAGGLLAAAQLVPTAMAGVQAHRAALATPDFWSLHPIALWETLVPQLFGNYYDAFLADLPWMAALNFGRDPFFYSLYVGPLVLLVAGVGLAARPRRNVFWVVILLVFLIAALGGYTPFYPLLRRLFPPLMYFRFPVKYVAISLFACGVLVADGFAALAGDGDPKAEPGTAPGAPNPPPWLPRAGARLAAAAGIGLLLSLVLFVTPGLVLHAADALAHSAHLKNPAAGAEFLARALPASLARTFGLLLAGCLLIAVAAKARIATPALFMALVADLVIGNGRLSLTTELAKLEPPAWYKSSAGPQRLYIGGRVRGFMNAADPDGTPTWQIPAESTAVEGRMELNAELPMAPSGWAVREALSYDLPYLWPSEYEAVVRQFEQSDPAGRAAFLRRSGVRRCVLPVSEPRQWRAVAEVPGWNMRVFECNPGATRVFIAASVEVAGDEADLTWQREALFDSAVGDDLARLAALPVTTAAPAQPEPPSARIVEDRGTTVVVEAASPRPAVLVLRDSFDPSWSASVDGTGAGIVRVNGFYRAVALPPGRHVIRFSYRPRALVHGLIISVMTACFLALSIAVSRRRRRPGGSAGFTLIELMVVLAIVAVLLAISFNQYRGMQARGNDTSALASMRAIAAAQWQFALTCGNMKYASALPDLAKPVPSTGEGFLSPDLTVSAEPFEKSGYMFQMAAKPIDGGAPACNGAVPANGYAVSADPVRPGATGVNFYGLNADRVIYVDQQQSFTGNLPESGPPGHGGEVK